MFIGVDCGTQGAKAVVVDGGRVRRDAFRTLIERVRGPRGDAGRPRGAGASGAEITAPASPS